MFDVPRVDELAKEIADFDRDTPITYGELIKVLSGLNRIYRTPGANEAQAEKANPRDLPGGPDWPDCFGAYIFRGVTKNRLRKMDS